MRRESCSRLIPMGIDSIRAFLSAIDPKSSSWTFQTIDDNKTRRDNRLTQILHGTLDQHFPTLAQLNERGAGVFFVPNETDLRGRKKTNIVRIRTLFVDLDGAPVEPVLSYPTPPNVMVNTSPERYHAYWRVQDCELEACEPALKQLISRFDGDPACSDRSRLMRLPGFLHCKGEPFLVSFDILSTEDAHLDQLILLPPKRQRKQKRPKTLRSCEGGVANDAIDMAVKRCVPTGEGQRNRSLFNLARRLRSIIPDAGREELRTILKRWHALSLSTIATHDFTLSWGEFWNAWTKVETPFGDTFAGIVTDIDFGQPYSATLIDRGLGPKDLKLTRLCEALQKFHAPEPFFLGCREAGALIGEDHKTANNRLRALEAEGLIECVEKGRRGRNTRYRYIDPN